MDTLFAARLQMEVSLAFHMVFAALGIAMPLLTVIAEILHYRTRDEAWLRLARTWSKVTALLFVVGAVSGTALSFELGLLWPRFMKFAGPIIGSAFALEGYAFFLEAIFVGLYLYGWEKLTPRAHIFCGLAVAFCGVTSGVLVVGANAWMQTPSGFTGIVDGLAQGVDPTAPFTNPSFAPLAIHSTLSCYVAVGFAVAGIYAFGMIRGHRDVYHRKALKLAMVMGLVAIVLQLVSGDSVAKRVHQTQPAKLAAMEAHFHTERGAPLLIGGIPDQENQTVRYGIHVPKALSFLATGDFNGEIKGLDTFPKDQHPNVMVLHVAFQIMVFGGSALFGVGGLWALLMFRARKKPADPSRWLLWAITLAGPLGFLALEAGWVVTEAGRQPWIVYGVMRTSDAVTDAPHIGLTFWIFSLLYLVLGVALVVMLRGIARHRISGRPTLLSITGTES